MSEFVCSSNIDPSHLYQQFTAEKQCVDFTYCTSSQQFMSLVKPYEDELKTEYLDEYGNCSEMNVISNMYVFPTRKKFTQKTRIEAEDVQAYLTKCEQYIPNLADVLCKIDTHWLYVYNGFWIDETVENKFGRVLAVVSVSKKH